MSDLRARTRRPDDQPIVRDGSLTVPERGMATWYLLAYANELKPGKVIERTLHGRPIVLYRGRTSKRVFALAAHCTHMGTNLRLGDVIDDELRCPMHHWRFAGDGTCTHATACDTIPSWARQRSFPVTEHYGAIFVHNGPDPEFPVPRWESLDGHKFRVGHTREMRIATPWTAIAVNAFDGVHLNYVHNRALRTTPTVEKLDPWRYRIDWHADVAGTHFADRVTRRIAAKRGVQCWVENWGGMVLIIESRVGRMSPSRLMIGIDPRGDETVVRAMFPVEHSVIPGWDLLRLWVQKHLFRRFLKPDVILLEGIDFRPRVPMPPDEPLGGALEFLDFLPEAR